MNSWSRYVTRSTGIVATVLMLASPAWGFLFSARETGRRLRPVWWLDLHKGLGGLAVVFTVVHLVTTLADSDLGVHVATIFVPGTSDRTTAAFTWGCWRSTDSPSQCSPHGRRLFRRRTWRAVHLLSVPATALACVHAYQHGSDARTFAFRVLMPLAVGCAVHPLGSGSGVSRCPSLSELQPSPEGVLTCRWLTVCMHTDLVRAFPPPAPIPPNDMAQQERLARLASNRAPRVQPAESARTTAPAGRTRKRHAAKGSRTAAVLMSLTTTAGLTAYFQHADTAGASNSTSALSGVAVASGTPASSSATTVPTPGTTAATADTAAGTSRTTVATSANGSGTTAATSGTTVATTTAAAAATTAAAASSTSASLADGTYTGATANNRYGPVQVQITVTVGKITAAVAVQTPTDRRSVSINDQATPILASEVVSAQSATIDTVSGATYTTNSYKASLQSAIDLARSTAVQAGASA